jgi:hypothetical protein
MNSQTTLKNGGGTDESFRRRAPPQGEVRCAHDAVKTPSLKRSIDFLIGVSRRTNVHCSPPFALRFAVHSSREYSRALT